MCLKSQIQLIYRLEKLLSIPCSPCNFGILFPGPGAHGPGVDVPGPAVHGPAVPGTRVDGPGKNIFLLGKLSQADILDFQATALVKNSVNKILYLQGFSQ